MKDVRKEIERIIEFINGYVYSDERVVIPVSGGLDSDVVARLCHMALGKERIKMFIVNQPDMEEKYLKNAQLLSKDLEVNLTVINLGKMNIELIKNLQEAEAEPIFNIESLLDPARAKCSLRSAILSTYQDKGFLIAGSTNRTEQELGFFLPFGDNLAHFKPIVHLYKSEVFKIAEKIGTHKEVLRQKPSAGFWKGQEDLEDLSFWIYNGGPIMKPRVFSDNEVKEVLKIKSCLSQEKIDICLSLYSEGKNSEVISEIVGMPESIVKTLIQIVEKSKIIKNRKLFVGISE